MDFLWEKDITPPRFPQLSGDVEIDVLIIGGGMAGVLCARALQERGVDYLLVEGKTIGSGITRGTTAVLTAQHGTLYYDLIGKFGIPRAKQYLDANLRAVDEFRALSKRIPCEFEEKPSYQYTHGDTKTLEREAKAVQSLGFLAEFVTKTPLPFEVVGAVQYPGMAQFHPLKFLYGAAQGLHIYENSFVRLIKNGVAYTDRGKIRAKKIIVTTHFPFLDRRGLYFMKLYQMRSFVIAVENAPNVEGTYTEDTESGMYLRNYNDLLLVGGGDHRTGKQGGGFAAVREMIARHFPGAREKFVWATQDCMSLDDVPYIGVYSPAMPNLYVATGFNEWGMTSSMVAASILADAVTGEKNEYADVFAPSRSMLRAQLFLNLGTTLADFVIPTTKRCSHLGCALRWNPQEHTWDCPCHGSRFDQNGRLMDNPATRDGYVG